VLSSEVRLTPRTVVAREEITAAARLGLRRCRQCCNVVIDRGPPSCFVGDANLHPPSAQATEFETDEGGKDNGLVFLVGGSGPTFR
jgi:hypothetical protein